ncbi:ATP-dependent DNA helicase chl1 [Branchiostoma belcheri]|nr:ATP-dependent DNA helicase chl1 [Branchiostoma belcheri]
MEFDKPSTRKADETRHPNNTVVGERKMSGLKFIIEEERDTIEPGVGTFPAVYSKEKAQKTLSCILFLQQDMKHVKSMWREEFSTSVDVMWEEFDQLPEWFRPTDCIFTQRLSHPVQQAFPMPPVITKQAPRKHIVDPRELIVIDCEATGSPEIRYSWLKNGRELDVDSDPNIAWSSAPNSGTITIELDGDNPDTSYEGKYQCKAANHRGTAVTNEIEVIITASPLFAFSEDKEITVPVGAHHVLECLSILGEAIPPPNIYWTKDGSNPIDLTERSPSMPRTT